MSEKCAATGLLLLLVLGFAAAFAPAALQQRGIRLRADRSAHSTIAGSVPFRHLCPAFHHHGSQQKQCFASTSSTAARKTTSTALSAGVDAELVATTWDWCANLGAPAALVAGAVLATLVDAREDMAAKPDDKNWIKITKKVVRALLLSSFGLEVISIFVTTVTGTMLLSHGDSPAGSMGGILYNSPMGFLMHNWEFEYMTARITFIQGLFNWLASVALEVLIPKEGEGLAARKMNRFISSALLTIIIGMLSFLNTHMTFYRNYGHMLFRYCQVVFTKFIWPPKPLTYIFLPSLITSLVFGFKAFRSSDHDEEEASAATAE